ncbi:MAG: class I SAM-dependent methyltransferase [Oscillospiraceae bacterium]|nr:class I SAM-dependent methyltransferase [Oscillospiraceae bacterium]MBQ6801634.1 class I SAM-dependent methyltransferase [Oscillospiraceae bacterium]
MDIFLNKDIKGKILDIGGGGEGIIGRLYKNQVVAIDNRQEELDEAPDLFEKRLMDAEKLDFPDFCFDAVTAFYSFMFMSTNTRRKAAVEMVRVLKNGGEIHIWDAKIPDAEKSPFCVDLKIFLPEETINTAYGIMGTGLEQSFNATKKIFEDLGLVCDKQMESENNFYLKFKK